MKKRTKIVAAALAAIMTLGLAGCSDKSSEYPAYRNPTDSVVETDEKYVVNVRSEGGLQLDDVKVTLSKDGVVIKRGISKDGKIEFGVALGEYDLTIDEDSLPEGYYLDGTKYKTNPSEREAVDVRIPSKVIAQAATSSTVYAVGDIIRDFVFTDCLGNEYKFSEVLKNKRAVMLNFWYSLCGPCALEFPAIQKAYSMRTDIEILALCSTHQGDTNAIVQDYRAERELTFPMGIDTIGLASNFGVSSFPTTIIVDRYGLIAYKDVGSEIDSSKWTSLFNDFTADDYVQKLSTEAGEDKPSEAERVKPNVEAPASSVLEAAANGEGLSATYRADEEDEYSWPWLAGSDDGGSYIYSSNKGVGNSYATVMADVAMKKDQVLSLEYNVSSEKNNDVLFALVDGELFNPDGWSATDGWKSANLYVADRDRTVELALIYQKDPADPDDGSIGEDVAKVRNINLADKSSIQEPMDVLRTCASGLEEGATAYSHYITPVPGDDGFYHVGGKTGPLIYISISQFTPWSDLHTGNSTTDAGGNTYYSTLYNLTYYNYASGEGDAFNVTIGGTDITKTLITYWNIQSYMEAPNYLMPVTEGLKVWAEAFVKDYSKKIDQASYENEWLEFCYYYDHYDGKSGTHADDVRCRAYDDPTHGLTPDNCYFAYETSDPALESSETKGKNAGMNKAIIDFPLQRDPGAYYSFTAKDAGVYSVRSYTKDCSSQGASPDVVFYDSNKNYLRSSGTAVRDFDQFKGVKYEGFNEYIYLDAGQQVYMRLADTPGFTGYYDFKITYEGASLDKLMVCSTAAGAWTYYEDTNVFYYLGVPVKLDSDENVYYVAGKDGEPDKTRPVYIDMIHGSFMYSELEGGEANFQSLEYCIEKNYFNDKIFLYGVDVQRRMQAVLAVARQGLEKGSPEAEAADETDPMYGLVPATKQLVEDLNKFIDNIVDGGRGESNGWLMFACYEEHFGKNV